MGQDRRLGVRQLTDGGGYMTTGKGWLHDAQATWRQTFSGGGGSGYQIQMNSILYFTDLTLQQFHIT